MAVYSTKPFKIEAVQWTGDNLEELKATYPDINVIVHRDGSLQVDDYLQATWVKVNLNDFIIKGMKGEYYPCDPEVFEAKYELDNASDEKYVTIVINNAKDPEKVAADVLNMLRNAPNGRR